jgi:hypothetical protein
MHTSRLICLVSIAVLLAGCGDRRSGKMPSSPRPAVSEPGHEALGRNLLINGDAESVGSVDKPTEKNAPENWSRTTDVQSMKYGGIPDEWQSSKPGCPDGRERYFRLALAINEQTKVISQRIALSGAEAEIAAGQVECALGGWFGGWVASDASAKVEVDFLGANGAKLGTLATEPPDLAAAPKPEAGRAALVKQVATGPVPPGTTQIEARLVALRLTKNVDNNAVAAADNLSLVLRKKEP